MTNEQIEAVLPFLAAFEAAGFVSAELRWSKASIFPWYEYAESASRFQQALYDHGWIEDFDWMKWTYRAKEYVERPEKIEKARIETIRKLLTTHVRQDRFLEGHLATMFRNGHIVALLRRLKAIHDTA